MNANEKIAFQNHLDQLHADFDSIKAFLEEGRKKSEKRDAIIDEIYRALYGDKTNKVEGIIDRQIRDDKFVIEFNTYKDNVEANTTFRLSIEKALKNLAWKVLGGAIISGGGGVGIYHLIKEIFKIKAL